MWRNKKSRFIQANPVRIGDYLYGTSGHPALVMGIDAGTGKRLWVERGFDQAAFLHADGKIIFLDWDGKLALATATPQTASRTAPSTGRVGVSTGVSPATRGTARTGSHEAPPGRLSPGRRAGGSLGSAGLILISLPWRRCPERGACFPIVQAKQT